MGREKSDFESRGGTVRRLCEQDSRSLLAQRDPAQQRLGLKKIRYLKKNCTEGGEDLHASPDAIDPVVNRATGKKEMPSHSHGLRG